MSILGIGSPLLDISAEVEAPFLEEYGLQLNAAAKAGPQHETLFAELEKRPGVQYTPGGATLNVVRAAQWLLQEPGATACLGCRGDDANGRRVLEACEAEGVKAAFVVDKAEVTGSCAVLVSGGERALCTRPGASGCFAPEHLRLPELWTLLLEARVVYIAAFFATVSPEVMRVAAKQAAASGASFCLNLSAPFLVRKPEVRALLQELLPLVDVLFGNASEALALAESEGWEPDVHRIAAQLSRVPSEKGKRTVVITQGPDPTVVATEGIVAEHPVLPVPAEELVDTNGAGDSYVGGFLAALGRGLPTAECCRAGAYVSSRVLRARGCTLSGLPSFSLPGKQ